MSTALSTEANPGNLPPAKPADAPIPRASPGTPAYRAASRALFVGGFGAFAMLYGMQPLMPVFSAEFGISPAAASGVVSLTTGCLALALIPAGVVAQRFGLKPTMVFALVASSLLTLLSACLHDFNSLLLLRALMGVVLAGMPAVAMAYLSEEIEPAALGRAMGLLIAGNALGGMSGRMVVSVLADYGSWRLAVGALGVVGLLSALEFWRSLPPARQTRASRFALAPFMADVRSHLSDAGLPWLFIMAFLLMGCLVSLYNYLGYRLGGAPFHLRTSVIGLVFSLYVVGMFSSAWTGRLADRLGRRRVLWVLIATMALGLALTLSPALPVLMLGVAVFTFGVFGAHTVASSWVARRALRGKTLASSLYLTAYYLGSGIIGSVSGLMWAFNGWHGVVAMLGCILLICLGVAWHLRTLVPIRSSLPDNIPAA